MKSNTTKRLALILVFMLVLLGGYGWLVFKLRSTIHSLSDTKLKVSEAEALQANEDSIKAFLADTVVERAKLDSFFVTQASLIEALDSLEADARRLSIDFSIKNISEFTPVETGKKDDTKDALEYQPLQVQWVALGSEEALLTFLTLTENTPREIIFERLSLEQNTAPEALSLHQLTGTMSFIESPTYETQN